MKIAVRYYACGAIHTKTYLASGIALAVDIVVLANLYGCHACGYAAARGPHGAIQPACNVYLNTATPSTTAGQPRGNQGQCLAM